MKKSLLLASFLITFYSHAQFKNFSLHLSANYPWIKNTEERPKPNVIPSPSGYSSLTIQMGTRQSFTEKVGYAISGRFDYSVSSRFFITTGLSMTCLRFQRSIEVINQNGQLLFPTDSIKSGTPVGSIYGPIISRDANGNSISHRALSTMPISNNLGNTTTWSLQVPILAGTSFFKDKLLMKAGVSFSYLLRVSEVKQQFSYSPTTATLSDYKDHSDEAYNKFLTAGLLEVTYQLTKRLGIDVTAQHFFTPIYKSISQPAETPRYNTLSFGVGYNF